MRNELVKTSRLVSIPKYPQLFANGQLILWTLVSLLHPAPDAEDVRSDALGEGDKDRVL